MNGEAIIIVCDESVPEKIGKENNLLSTEIR